MLGWSIQRCELIDPFEAPALEEKQPDEHDVEAQAVLKSMVDAVGQQQQEQRQESVSDTSENDDGGGSFVKKSATYKEVHLPYTSSPRKIKTRLSWNDPTTGNEDALLTRKVQTYRGDVDDEANITGEGAAGQEADAEDYPVRKSATYKEVHHSPTAAPIKMKTRLSWNDDPTSDDKYGDGMITQKIQTSIPLKGDINGSCLDQIINLGSKLKSTGIDWNATGIDRSTLRALAAGRRSSPSINRNNRRRPSFRINRY